MATMTPELLHLGPDSAGISLAPEEFDRADFEEGWRYELIKGVLVVSPPPLEQERDPNEELGYWLRLYKDRHPQGGALDKTLPEHLVATGDNRRRADRVLWIGLGRLPTVEDVPAVVAEFVSKGKRNYQRDYVEKRDAYMAIRVQEYWLIDRFRRIMTVFFRQGKRIKTRVVQENEIYSTPLLPGFELPLAPLLELADAWSAIKDDDQVE
jgi:Uma2 family endonuclease